MVPWVLVPLQFNPASQCLEKVPSFPDYFPFLLLGPELAGGVCQFVFTVFHYFPSNSLSVS